MKFVHDDVIVELSRCFFREALRIERLNWDKQIIDAFRFTAAHEHLSKVRILEYGSECVQTLFKNFFAVCDKKQAAGPAGIMSAEAFVV